MCFNECIEKRSVAKHTNKDGAQDKAKERTRKKKKRQEVLGHQYLLDLKQLGIFQFTLHESHNDYEPKRSFI